MTQGKGNVDNEHEQKKISATTATDKLDDRARHSSPTITISDKFLHGLNEREKYIPPSVIWDNESRNKNSLEVSELKLLLPGIQRHKPQKSATGEENHFTVHAVESTSEYSSLDIKGNNNHATAANVSGGYSKDTTNNGASSKRLDMQMGDGQALKSTSNPSELSDSTNDVTLGKQVSAENVNQASLHSATVQTKRGDIRKIRTKKLEIM